MVEEVLTFEVWFGWVVHGNLGIDPPTQTARADPKTGRLDAGDGRRWVSTTKNRLKAGRMTGFLHQNPIYPI